MHHRSKSDCFSHTAYWMLGIICCIGIVAVILAYGKGSFAGHEKAQVTMNVASSSCQGMNIKDFGVKGDGVTDDTKAMQGAFDGRVSGTFCFPAGRYVISAPIIFRTDAVVRSDGGALIEQKCKTCNVFVYLNRYNVTVQGMKFLSGAFQVLVLNDTSKPTTIYIADSEFHGSTATSVYTGTIPNSIMPGSVTIVRSKFVDDKKAFTNITSSGLMQDSWVTAHKNNFAPNTSVFLNRPGASLTLDNVLGVPVMGSGSKRIPAARWVDNYGTFVAKQTRFGGEDGGMPIVYEFDNGTLGTLSTVITDSQISGGLGLQPDSAVIVLKTAIPKTIVLSGNNYLIGSPYIVSQGLDLGQYISSKNASPDILIESNLAYPINASNQIIPKELQSFTHWQSTLISPPPPKFSL